MSDELRIEQDSRQKAPGWWWWAVWIAGDEAALARVRKVVWYLHPTFPEPVVTRTSRADGFRLETSGWGEFALRAQVHPDDGESYFLEHRLRLFTDEGEAAADRGAAEELPSSGSAGREDDTLLGVAVRSARAAGAGGAGHKAPRVFISHSFGDADLAQALRDSLRSKNVEASLGREPAASSGGRSLGEEIDDSDLVVSLDSAASGEFVDIEKEVARQRGKPVIEIAVDAPAADDQRSPRLTYRGRGLDVAGLSDHILASLKGSGGGRL